MMLKISFILNRLIKFFKSIYFVRKSRFKYIFLILIFLSCDLILYNNVCEYDRDKSSNLFAYNSRNLYASISRKDILLYGNNACFFCVRLKKDLKNEGIPFIFYNVSENEYRNAEMRRKFIKAFPDQNVVHFPMVEVRGKILLRPSVKEILSYLE